MVTVLSGWVWGLTQGLQHALEPDHLAAVSTMVAEQRTSRAGLRFASAWGVGHALVLFAVGGALMLLRVEMPDRAVDVFELLVAVMLIGLGVRALGRAFRPRAARATHAGHAHPTRWTWVKRPFLVGIVHGLAGSGAVAALVVAKTPSALSGLVFIALYGLGATAGMALLAGIAGVPLARIARHPRGVLALLAITGVFSLVLGFIWGIPVVARLATG